MKYYRIAKDNTSCDINSYAKPEKPDFHKLNSIIELIDEKKDNDPVAKQVIDLVSGYLAFVEMSSKELDKKKKHDLENLDKKIKATKENLEKNRKDIVKSCKLYLYSKSVMDLVKLFGKLHDSYEIDLSSFDKWKPASSMYLMMLLGFSKYIVDSPKSFNPDMKKIFMNHFDEKNRTINSPIGFRNDRSMTINIEYVPENEQKLKRGIQALLFNYFRYVPIQMIKVSLFDYVNFNADLIGSFSEICGIKDGIFSDIPYDTKSAKRYFVMLSNYYKKIESIIGAKTVYEYNKGKNIEKSIPYRLLVIRTKNNSLYQNDSDELIYLKNNAARLGITLVLINKSDDGGSFGKEILNKMTHSLDTFIDIVSSSSGDFYIYNSNKNQWFQFSWLDFVDSIPEYYVNQIKNALIKKEIGTKYFKRYKPDIPKRSKGKRKPIEVPFAIDENDNPVVCSFENELFAAYMMGASRSGKSTLLHIIICGLITRYHPDELELWLMDFKMLEFKRYVDHQIPHVKYVLLEKSEDLVFDIVDQLEKKLTEREYIFSQNGWYKLTDVPPDVYMPAIFVIMDEFAQMSQILKETKGDGLKKDYTLKIANLLQKGAAMGFKFIFASQTYSDGVEGLTESARKQIQLRFALKNVPQEIKDTLMISSGDMDDQLERDIATLPPYECIYKWRDKNNKVRVKKLRNMYADDQEVNKLADYVKSKYQCITNFNCSNDYCYKDKKSIMVDGNYPKTFQSQLYAYKNYESSINPNDYDDNDYFIYAGVPSSFNIAAPFVLGNSSNENILLAGGDVNESLNVLLSIFISYARNNKPIEIWSHRKESIYRNYKLKLDKFDVYTDLGKICTRVKEIKETIRNRKYMDRLVVIIGYNRLITEMELLSELENEIEAVEDSENEETCDLSEIMMKIQECSNPEEKKKIITQYNSMMDSSNQNIESTKKQNKIYDAKSDIEWLLKVSSSYGVHFLFCFTQVKDFSDNRMNPDNFNHKLLFSMSRDDSVTLISNRKASEIPAGTMMYTDGKNQVTMRPHIHIGVPNNGWIIDSKGHISKR
jgi:hypothetical protein